MPELTDTRLSLDISDYLKLPIGDKLIFDGWFKAEGLADKRVVKIRLERGVFTIMRTEILPGRGFTHVEETWELGQPIPENVLRMLRRDEVSDA